MTKRRWLWIVIAVAVVAGVTLWRYRGNDFRTPYTSQFSNGLEKSADLKKDSKLMWETQPLRGTPDPSHGPNPRASTQEAIEAASRVFNTVELVGKTREDVVTLLGDPKSSNDSIYNFPFWPAPKGCLVYRFDCGSYGWQFNVVLASDGKVTEIQRAWIH